MLSLYEPTSGIASHMRQVTAHTLDYVDAAMASILSPDILPVEELRDMLKHIKAQLPQ